ncbi:MAG: energy-coupling factor transporter ATPase [Clostridiales bacterium]|nr:energy-coupling factor transporter ATPase [Clostridiales bacterium]
MGIDVRHLSYTYNPGTPFETKAVDDVSFEIRDGEFVGIIGHTGSGKSTLIQHLNALIEPTSGSVLVDGEDINFSKNKTSLRRRIGLVFQYPEYQLFEETVLKDVSFGPKNIGKTEDECLSAARQALQLVGLSEDSWEKSPFELSGGQQRRAALAGVLAMQPEVLILDEPAAGLDPSGRKEILNIIRRIHSYGTTVVMVSHSMDDVARLCDRIIVMEKGKKVMDGTPAEVFSCVEELEAMGLKPPSAALLAKRLKQRGIDINDGIYTLADLADELKNRLGGIKKGA